MMHDKAILIKCRKEISVSFSEQKFHLFLTSINLFWKAFWLNSFIQPNLECLPFFYSENHVTKIRK